jgi:uncharacterized protein YbdZ (MbtH family)
MHCQQAGEVWACFGLLNASRRFSSGLEPFLGFVVHRSDRSRSSVWPVRCAGPVYMLSIGLTGQSWAVVAALFWDVVCMHSSRGSCIGSGGACMCAGGSLCGFRALDGWHMLFSRAWFCLTCVEPLPLPKGSETCLLQVILLFAFLWHSIACWSFY